MITFPIIKDIINLYSNENKTLLEIADKYKVSKSTISYHLRKFGVEIRKRTSRNRINHNYFSVIDTEAKAYFLGLLYADGNINRAKTKVTISLQEDDSYILERFRDDIGHSYPLGYIDRSNEKYKTHKHKNCKILSFTSKKICSDLINLGCVPNKSYRLEFPFFDKIPNDLFHHFIRGCFDGDGTVFITKISGRGETCKCGIYGTELFCKALKNRFLDEIGCNFHYYKSKLWNCYSVFVNSLPRVYRFYKFIYKTSNFFLTRKKNIFEEYIFSIRKVKDEEPKLFIKKSKYKGVAKLYKKAQSHKQKWAANITFNKKKYYLGLFDTEVEAAKAFDEKHIELYGFSVNFI